MKLTKSKNSFGSLPTEIQIDLLKKIHAKTIVVAKNLSMWKQINILEKKDLISTDANGDWQLTEKGKAYV